MLSLKLSTLTLLIDHLVWFVVPQIYLSFSTPNIHHIVFLLLLCSGCGLLLIDLLLSGLWLLLLLQLLLLLFLLDREIQFKFCGQFILGIQTIGKVNPANSAICVNLNAESFYIIGTIGSSCEICEVKLNFVPAVICKKVWNLLR